jgi:hypothetical protein
MMPPPLLLLPPLPRLLRQLAAALHVQTQQLEAPVLAAAGERHTPAAAA